MLELRDLALRTGAAPINHRFEAGAISVVLGRNHSGKTRLTRILAGLDTPTGGEILLRGAELNPLGPGERSVALVYQAFVNYPNWTVFENLASPLVAKAGRLRRRRREPSQTAGQQSVDDRVRDIAGKLGLDSLLDRLPSELSGGQQQRLAIGRALAKSADVLVMDEPLVNLDYKLREALQLELRALLHDAGTGAQGLCVIYTTSDPRDAFTLGDELVLLADYEVVQSGTPLNVFEQPVSPVAADLMSDPNANRWRQDGSIAMVRPEHLHLEARETDDVAFPIEVLGSETNGSETFVHCRPLTVQVPSSHWVARLDGLVDLEAGAQLTLYASAASVLMFVDNSDGRVALG